MTLQDLVLQVATLPNPTKDDFLQAKKDYGRINKLSGFPSNMQILQVYRDMIQAGTVSENKVFLQLLKKRAIRSQSGIVSVQVLTKPFWCPGKCIFCPNDFTMPKSYINTEPGAMRALLNNFDPIKQVYNRLLSLTLTGHDTDKIEMIVLGGTRDVYPKEYKERFIKGLYYACNTFPDFLKTVKLTSNANKSLFSIEDGTSPVTNGNPLKDKGDEGDSSKIEDSVQSLIANTKLPHNEKKKEVWSDDMGNPIHDNESAEHRIIGLTVETRPEYVTDENCQFWRTLGVTRLEMGIQSTNDEVLDMNKRGHNLDTCKKACHKLRQYGFKFSVHLMPGLYGSDENKDLQTFIDIYSDDHFKPDEIKFYPTSVIPNTELYDLYKQGIYKPIETDAIKRIITTTFRDIIPPYTRIKRLIRDIPSTEIAAGSATTNLAQLMHEGLYKERRMTDLVKKIYARLYENAKYYDTVEEFLSPLAPRSGEELSSNDEKKSIKNKRHVIGVTTPEIIQRAKHLRNNMTETEQIVWKLLVDNKIGSAKRRRQHPIHSYIIDFCSIEKMIAIELDGGYHNTPEQQEADEIRQKDLEDLGFTVIRFSNTEVLENQKNVVKKIEELCEVPYPDQSPLAPLPGEGITTHIIGGRVDTESDRAFVSLDTRSREVRHRSMPKQIIPTNEISPYPDDQRKEGRGLGEGIPVIRQYQSSVGTEFFIAIEDNLGYLYGFTRLLLAQEGETITYPGLGAGTALIRELHVYGQVEKIGETEGNSTQHTGIGKTLMGIAEKIASTSGYSRISVIAGVGVREYYHKLGYKLEGTYMVKGL